MAYLPSISDNVPLCNEDNLSFCFHFSNDVRAIFIDGVMVPKPVVVKDAGRVWDAHSARDVKGVFCSDRRPEEEGIPLPEDSDTSNPLCSVL